MEAENVLDKTNRINLLFDFYQRLLTDKQQTFMKLYFQDNFSLAEIAEEYAISRQAVNEHIKRAEHMLEEYEDKLHLLANYKSKIQYINEIRTLISLTNQNDKEDIQMWLQKIADAD